MLRSITKVGSIIFSEFSLKDSKFLLIHELIPQYSEQYHLVALGIIFYDLDIFMGVARLPAKGALGYCLARDDLFDLQ